MVKTQQPNSPAAENLTPTTLVSEPKSEQVLITEPNQEIANKLGLNIKKPGLKNFKSVIALSEVAEEKLADNQSIQSDYSEPKQSKSFTKAQAIGILAEFASQKTSTNYQIVIKSDFKVEIFELTFLLLNKIQVDIFYEIKQELLDVLRKKLENNEIQIEAIITTEESKAKPRTEQEKFEAMALKNPEMRKLKESLGLDLIF